MSNPNFASLLNEAPTEVVRPKPVPTGTYICVVQKWEQKESAKQKTPFIEFTLSPIAADDDVDPDELDAAGGLENKSFRVPFFVTDDAIYRLDDFHAHCGLDLSDAASRIARCDAVINSQVKAFIKHEPSQDGQTIYAKVGRTLSAD